MALKLIIIAVLLYFVARAVMNLWRAVQVDEGTPSPHRAEFQPDQPMPNVSGKVYRQEWYVRRDRTSSKEMHEVEDARWHDVQ